MLRLKKKAAQSTLEYAVIIAVIVGALIAMQIYIKRGIQGRFREASDQIGEQFSPETSTSNYTTISNTAQTENVVAGGQTTTSITTGSQSRTGSESVGTLNQEVGGAAAGGAAAGPATT